MSRLECKSNRIWVTFTKEGIHRYPAAAHNSKLATGDWDDVSFLAHPHRHIFHIRVDIDVWHDDREIEFIQFKRWLERLFSMGTIDLNNKSCEMIADILAVSIHGRYPDRSFSVSVSEDNENGAIKHYEVH